MNNDIICIIALAITAMSSAVSVVGFVMAKFVKNVAGKPDDRVLPANRRHDCYITDVHGWPIGMAPFRTSNDVNDIARRDEDWINALIERHFGPSCSKVIPEVFESDYGDWNLAYIHDADGCFPDLRLELRKGQSLVNVGARKLRVVVGPVPTDLPNGPERAPTGHDGTDGGHEGKDKRQNLKGSHADHYSISACEADAILTELRGEIHSEMFKRTVTRLVENARSKRRG